MDCLPFLNWEEVEIDTENEKAVVFRSLAATVKLHPSFDISMEEKAVKFLKYVIPKKRESARSFLSSFASCSDDSLTAFVQCIVVLISSPNHVDTRTAMKLLRDLIYRCSDKIRLALVKADLVPQLINTLNLQYLFFAEVVDIRSYLMCILSRIVWLSTPVGLAHLRCKDDDDKQSVRETVLKQVLAPSEHYICHLCENRFSIVEGKLSITFTNFLTKLLQICPYYRLTMDFVLNMPIVLTIANCLTSVECDNPIHYFLNSMNKSQQEWNVTRRKEREMWTTMQRMLRMEGIDDVIEEKLQHDQITDFGGDIVARSIEWNNLQGMNSPEP